MRITYEKQDDTYFRVFVNEEQIGWIEKHKLNRCYWVNLFFDKCHIPKEEYTKENITKLITAKYKQYRFQTYSEVTLEKRGFKILA